MRSLFLIGRALFGGFFIYNGLNHLKHSAVMEGYAASKGVRAPAAAVNGTAALLLAGGVSVVAGVKPRQGLAALVAFLAPTTLQMHRFWEQEDPQQRMGEMVNFTKNVALIGAASTSCARQMKRCMYGWAAATFAAYPPDQPARLLCVAAVGACAGLQSMAPCVRFRSRPVSPC
jgi:putative oxidoreductase